MDENTKTKLRELFVENVREFKFEREARDLDQILLSHMRNQMHNSCMNVATVQMHRVARLTDSTDPVRPQVSDSRNTEAHGANPVSRERVTSDEERRGGF